MKTHLTVIEMWPNAAALARDLSTATPTVRYWKREQRIPPHRYDDILEAACRRGFPLTYAELTEAGRK